MMMKRGMSGPFLLLLLSSSVLGLGSVVSRNYRHVQIHANWEEAQRICKSSLPHSELATIHTQSELDSMYLKNYDAWVGLYKESTDPWSWTYGGGSSSIIWAKDEPRSGDDCASVYYISKKFYGTSCASNYFFICSMSQDNNDQYKFIPQSKNWSEARQYCKDRFYDLTRLYSESSYDLAVVEQNFPVWIGLHRDGQTWKWCAGQSEFRKWAGKEPGQNGNCVSISASSKEMATQDCSARFPFVCFTDNLVLVKEEKTWEEALEHCRALRSTYHYSKRYELLSVQPGDDHSYIMAKVMKASTEKVWTALRFLAGQWLWINEADMLYPNLPLCPVSWKHCGALSKNDTGHVENIDCSEKLNFLCYST